MKNKERKNIKKLITRVLTALRKAKEDWKDTNCKEFDGKSITEEQDIISRWMTKYCIELHVYNNES